MPHVVLLGDSIFDNAAYVGRGPDVIQQLTRRLPDGWRATLLAQDGAVLSGVRGQLGRLPADATHLVVSVGGNDALRHSGILDQAAPSIAEALLRLASISAEFERDYAAMLDIVLARGLGTAICTIYDPNYPDPIRQRLAVTALKVLNDPILRLAARRGVPVIDLRLVCDHPGDYANPIEPSIQGGEKISAVILETVRTHDFGRERSAIYR
jgi:hypothetical protein